MNVEIGTEAVQFPEKEYINGFLLQCVSFFDFQLPVEAAELALIAC
jgi:hypothetical protein